MREERMGGEAANTLTHLPTPIPSKKKKKKKHFQEFLKRII